MRVIAGKYRGKILKEFTFTTTKPTLDRVKESLFSSVQFDIIDATVLDLFSGTGALGIEAISRGAKHVDFVDNNIDAINLIKQNLKGVEGEYNITKGDYLSFLNETKSNKRYDLILLDPPFNSDFGLKAIEFIITNNLLSDKGIIMYECLYDPSLNLEFDGYNIKYKKYGTVGLFKITRQ